MDTNEYYNDLELDDEEDLSIDWATYVIKLQRCWKTIAVFSILFAVLGVGVALTMKRAYTVSVVLAPETQGKSSSGSGLSGIAGMLGLGSVSLGGGSDALNITLFPEISQSTLFLTKLFDVEVTPYVSPKDLKKGVPPASPTTLYNYITEKDEEANALVKWMKGLFGVTEDLEPDTLNVAQLSPMQRGAVKALRKAVSANVDKKTGMVTISVTIDDPWIATTLADTVCQRLQNYVIAYRTKKAAEDLEYYETLAAESKEKMIKAQSAYALSVDFDRSVILQSVNSEKERLQREAQLASDIYSQMAQQVEMAKAKLQEVKPVFAVVEAATMPERPSSTGRKVVVLGFMFLGFCTITAWKLFGEELVLGFKQEITAKLEEEKANDPEEVND